MAGLLRPLGAAALAVGVLAYPAAWAVDAVAGRDLLVVEAADAAAVEVNRGLWELNGSPKAEVAGIYGPPVGKGATRLVGVPESKVLRPKEDPTLAIYLKAADDHPVQAQTLYYFALPAALGGTVVGAGLMLLAARRKRAAPPSAASAPAR